MKKTFLFILAILMTHSVYSIKINFDLKCSPQLFWEYCIWVAKSKPVHGTIASIGITVCSDALLKAIIKRKIDDIPGTFYEPIIIYSIIGAALASINDLKDKIQCLKKLLPHQLLVFAIILATAILASIPTEILNIIENKKKLKKHLISAIKQSFLNAESFLISYLTTLGLKKADLY